MSSRLYKPPEKKKKVPLPIRIHRWFWEDVNPGSWSTVPRWMWWTVIGLMIVFAVKVLSGEIQLF